MKAIAAVLPGRNSVQTRLAVQFGIFTLALGCMARFGTSAETVTAIFFVTVLVVLSEFVPRHWWENLLHNQTALRLKLRLFTRPNTIVADVPYHL